MSKLSTSSPLIIETSRGPSVAGRRTTVYTILEHVKKGLEKEFIKEHLSLSDDQLNAALEYIDEHRDEVERDYAEILRRSDQNRDYYETQYRERSRHAGLTVEERTEQMRRDLANK